MVSKEDRASCEGGVCKSNDSHWTHMCKKHDAEWKATHERWAEERRTGVDNYIPSPETDQPTEE